MRDYRKLTKSFCIGDVAQDSDAIKTPIWYLEQRIKIDKVRFGADTAQAAVDTNYNKIALTDVTNDIASITLGPAATGDSLVAGVFLAKTPAAAHAEKAAGTTLQIEYTKTGTGVAVSGLVVQIDYYEYDT